MRFATPNPIKVERADSSAVQSMENARMKTRYRILLASSASFLIGFAVCYHLLVDDLDQQSSSAAFSNVVQPAPSGVTASYETPRIPRHTWYYSLEGVPPPTFSPRQSWQVTIWHPTIPPQKAGTFDPLEHVAKSMGITNR
jgi:hypothetical protein